MAIFIEIPEDSGESPAFDAGFKAFLMWNTEGGPETNTYPDGSTEAVDFDRGWEAAEKAYDDALDVLGNGPIGV